MQIIINIRTLLSDFDTIQNTCYKAYAINVFIQVCVYEQTEANESRNLPTMFRQFFFITPVLGELSSAR